MKVGVYEIINNPLPQLHNINMINVKKSECQYDEDIVRFLNRELLLNKMASEHIYALALSLNIEPLGILQLVIGNNKESIADIKALGCGLLLLGAEQFMCFHNHPGGVRKISQSDKELTLKYKMLSDVLDITFIRHLLITKNTFLKCE